MKFADVLERFNIPFLTEGRHCRPGWLQLDCPYCKGTLYLGFNTVGNYLNCWRCGPQRILATLAELTGEDWKKLKPLVGDLEKERQLDLPIRGKLVLPKYLGKLLPAHKKYLRGRGFDPKELVRLWGIQGIGVASRLRWRVFIPIRYRDQIVSWTTRKLGDSGLRYQSASASEEMVNHKELLYGEDYCRHSVIVHEGPFDVWRTGPGAVCTFGTGYKRSQVVKLARYSLVCVCFDNESKAQQRARDLCDLLEPMTETYNVVLSGKDAASTKQNEIDKLRRKFIL